MHYRDFSPFPAISPIFPRLCAAKNPPKPPELRGLGRFVVWLWVRMEKSGGTQSTRTRNQRRFNPLKSLIYMGKVLEGEKF